MSEHLSPSYRQAKPHDVCMLVAAELYVVDLQQQGFLYSCVKSIVDNFNVDG